MCPLGSSNAGQLFECATGIIVSSFIPLVFTLAAVFFVWGAIKFFIINADEEAKRTQGKQFMIWAIIAFAVISSIWGIVRILTTTFGTNSGFVIPGVTPQGGVSNSGGGGGGVGGRCTPACSPLQTCENGVCVNSSLCPNPGNECSAIERCADPDRPICACGYCESTI